VLQDWTSGSHPLKTKIMNTGGRENPEQHGRSLRAQAEAEDTGIRNWSAPKWRKTKLRAEGKEKSGLALIDERNKESGTWARRWKRRPVMLELSKTEQEESIQEELKVGNEIDRPTQNKIRDNRPVARTGGAHSSQTPNLN
jgi:hypothetical protein